MRPSAGWPVHRRTVGKQVYDHTSILKMIEWRFGLPPLTPRDKAARNLAEVLDFSAKPNLAAPRYKVPLAVSKPCVTPNPADYEEWRSLRSLATRNGFPAPVAIF